jgi:hypothetical protein
MRKNTIKDNIKYYIKMDYIHEANDSFRFDKLHLTKPTPITGGNYFIKFLVGDMSLYIQPPKCKLKDGITKAGKKLFADLVFNNENEQFIRWIENLENYSQEIIYKNREAWFDGGLEKHDIENYFTSPLKIYKSGKYSIFIVCLHFFRDFLWHCFCLVALLLTSSYDLPLHITVFNTQNL